jgi:hypothetical protein
MIKNRYHQNGRGGGEGGLDSCVMPAKRSVNSTVRLIFSEIEKREGGDKLNKIIEKTKIITKCVKTTI